MHRFFVPPAAILGDVVRFPPATAEQIARVLRLRPGDEVAVLDGAGTLYRVTLRQVTREAAEGQATHREAASGEPSVHLALYAALLKGDRFEWTLQKGAELGVARFIPMVTERTVARSLTITTTRRMRWERIVQEAAEVCGRARLPQIAEPLSFEAACAEAARAEMRLIAWEAEEGRSLEEAWGAHQPASVALMIGPEGGFTNDEVMLAMEHGFIPFSLGPRLLRAETASVVAVTLVLHRAGELRPRHAA